MIRAPPPPTTHPDQGLNLRPLAVGAPSQGFFSHFTKQTLSLWACLFTRLSFILHSEFIVFMNSCKKYPSSSLGEEHCRGFGGLAETCAHPCASPGSPSGSSHLLPLPPETPQDGPPLRAAYIDTVTDVAPRCAYLFLPGVPAHKHLFTAVSLTALLMNDSNSSRTTSSLNLPCVVGRIEGVQPGSLAVKLGTSFITSLK